MRKYQSHKTVEAAKIVAAEKHHDGEWSVVFEDGSSHRVKHPQASRFHITEEDPGYYVLYDDGYISWSPSKAFEQGYTEIAA
jgi:hypothetical protein